MVKCNSQCLFPACPSIPYWKSSQSNKTQEQNKRQLYGKESVWLSLWQNNMTVYVEGLTNSIKKIVWIVNLTCKDPTTHSLKLEIKYNFKNYFFVVFKTGSHFVGQASLELTM